MRAIRIWFLAALSFGFNFVVMIYLASDRFSNMPSVGDVSLYRNSRYFIAATAKPAEADRSCSKSIIYFGLRQHWFTFCSFPEFAQYKHMIEFPRTVNCPEVNCSVKVDYTQNAADIIGHDIVVFTDVNEWMKPEMWDWLHGNRTEGQIWTMITEESPLYVPGVQPPAKYANKSFDWIDSYMSGADFVHPYGKYEKYCEYNRPPAIDIRQFLIGKTKLISWMGSHCETLQWDRMKFVEAVKQIITVDTYGKCGDKEVPWNNDQIILDTLGKYKFYLSLENSCCNEYLTEKFWRALEMGMVPVVLGAPLEHYRKLAPPNSFIHVDQFNTLAELAVHLITLHSNDERYLEYHKWRNEGKLISYGQEEQYVRPLNNETQCSMLGKLLNTDLKTQRKLDYFGPRWYGSCMKCGEKEWISKFLHAEDHQRSNSDIWA
ncbi:4-galactosyl-N-acetylglucosaminide 3-alpha-L-fucosyltransferase FUT6-like [Apostichopus japonicus]|uniref:4-galactosyl-N-acetylglucosaminide 3-alpha-L-fucosyltransferase FUT6-like n=1 Tax=Stichopus japonicus TaxID=307972 RepID=UPI003AB15E2A